MRNTLNTALVAFFLLIAAPLLAQTPMGADDAVQMADGLYANGKIYVVVAVILTIVAGLVLYMIRLDRKITRLEKEA
ncbi:MAG TPA: hypothetical protein VIK80_11570 [Flavihumibacter sp.]|jgi:hypothetical protein